MEQNLRKGNELIVLDEREVLGKEFRMYGSKENPLFLAKDVANWIGHKKPNEMIANVDEDEKEKIKINYGDNNARVLQNNTEYWFLTEDGLYEVLMQSRKPIAKQFKKEVKYILKQIRKHGAYMTESTLEHALTSPDFLIKLATNLKEEQEKRRLLEEEKKLNAPKVIFADAVSASKGSILIGELAKILKQNGVETGQNKLFAWLRENKFLISRKGSDYNMPTQKSMELGLFEIKETSISHADGHTSINKTPKVTGKGQQYFINKFLN